MCSDYYDLVDQYVYESRKSRSSYFEVLLKKYEEVEECDVIDIRNFKIIKSSGNSSKIFENVNLNSPITSYTYSGKLKALRNQVKKRRISLKRYVVEKKQLSSSHKEYKLISAFERSILSHEGLLSEDDIESVTSENEIQPFPSEDEAQAESSTNESCFRPSDQRTPYETDSSLDKLQRSKRRKCISRERRIPASCKVAQVHNIKDCYVKLSKLCISDDNAPYMENDINSKCGISDVSLKETNFSNLCENSMKFDGVPVEKLSNKESGNLCEKFEKTTLPVNKFNLNEKSIEASEKEDGAINELHLKNVPLKLFETNSESFENRSRKSVNNHPNVPHNNSVEDKTIKKSFDSENLGKFHNFKDVKVDAINKFDSENNQKQHLSDNTSIFINNSIKPLPCHPLHLSSSSNPINSGFNKSSFASSGMFGDTTLSRQKGICSFSKFLKPNLDSRAQLNSVKFDFLKYPMGYGLPRTLTSRNISSRYNENSKSAVHFDLLAPEYLSKRLSSLTVKTSDPTKFERKTVRYTAEIRKLDNKLLSNESSYNSKQEIKTLQYPIPRNMQKANKEKKFRREDFESLM